MIQLFNQVFQLKTLVTVYAVIFAGSNFRGFESKICTLIFAVFNFRGHR